MKSVRSLLVTIYILIPFLYYFTSAFQSMVIVMLKEIKKMRKVVGLEGRFDVAVRVVAFLIWSRS